MQNSFTTHSLRFSVKVPHKFRYRPLHMPEKNARGDALFSKLPMALSIMEYYFRCDAQLPGVPKNHFTVVPLYFIIVAE
eukprot:2148894-Pleurochrysis_carterae.AAC.1